MSKKKVKKTPKHLRQNDKMIKMQSELNRLRKKLERVDDRVAYEAKKNSKKYAKKHTNNSKKSRSRRPPPPPGWGAPAPTAVSETVLQNRIDELEKTVFTLIDRLEAVEEEYRSLTRPSQIVM